MTKLSISLGSESQHNAQGFDLTWSDGEGETLDALLGADWKTALKEAHKGTVRSVWTRKAAAAMHDLHKRHRAQRV